MEVQHESISDIYALDIQCHRNLPAHCLWRFHTYPPHTSKQLNVFVKLRANEKSTLHSLHLLLVVPVISVCSPGPGTSHATFPEAFASTHSTSLHCSGSLAHTYNVLHFSTSSFPGHQPCKSLWLADYLLTLTFLGSRCLSDSPLSMHR